MARIATQLRYVFSRRAAASVARIAGVRERGNVNQMGVRVAGRYALRLCMRAGARVCRVGTISRKSIDRPKLWPPCSLQAREEARYPARESGQDGVSGVGAVYGRCSVSSCSSAAVASSTSSWRVDQDNAMLDHSQTVSGPQIQRRQTNASSTDPTNLDRALTPLSAGGAAKLMASLTTCGVGHGATGGLFHLTCSVTILHPRGETGKMCSDKTAAPTLELPWCWSSC